MLNVGDKIKVRGSEAIVTAIEDERWGRDAGTPRFIHYTTERGVRDVCPYSMFSKYGAVERIGEGVTDSDIESLRDEAALAGDDATWLDARRALEGHSEARMRCVSIIAEARAAND